MIGGNVNKQTTSVNSLYKPLSNRLEDLGLRNIGYMLDTLPVPIHEDMQQIVIRAGGIRG